MLTVFIFGCERPNASIQFPAMTECPLLALWRNVFTFWFEYQNRNLVTGRAFEPRRREPPTPQEGG